MFTTVYICFVYAVLATFLKTGPQIRYMNSNEELVNYLVRQGFIKSDRVKQAFLSVDRKEFVPKVYQGYAYVDEPLPIGHDQTISAPSIIAEMLERLDVRPGNKVLEVGTGSGYVTALLAELAKPGYVYSIEIVPEIIDEARRRLSGYKNIHVFVASGWVGLPEYAPYDRIYLGCAPDVLPDALLNQLVNNGKAVLPLGRPYTQKLVLVEKTNKGLLTKDLRTPVSFVPMVRR